MCQVSLLLIIKSLSFLGTKTFIYAPCTTNNKHTLQKLHVHMEINFSIDWIYTRTFVLFNVYLCVYPIHLKIDFEKVCVKTNIMNLGTKFWSLTSKRLDKYTQ